MPKAQTELSALIPSVNPNPDGRKHTVGRGLCRLVLSDGLTKGE